MILPTNMSFWNQGKKVVGIMIVLIVKYSGLALEKVIDLQTELSGGVWVWQ